MVPCMIYERYIPGSAGGPLWRGKSQRPRPVGIVCSVLKALKGPGMKMSDAG